jgi:hypothetical protein
MDEDNKLEVVDTKNVLTKEELDELKKLAHASKIVKWVVVTIFGLTSMVGFDKIVAFFTEPK